MWLATTMARSKFQRAIRLLLSRPQSVRAVPQHQATAHVKRRVCGSRSCRAGYVNKGSRQAALPERKRRRYSRLTDSRPDKATASLLPGVEPKRVEER